MNVVCKTKKNHICVSRVPLPKETKKEFIYLLQIGAIEGGMRLIKIGTTDNIKRRMAQLLRHYATNIEILWISHPYAHFTTLRVEDNMKKIWREFDGFQYIRNDRFLIPAIVEGLTVTVRKDFPIIF